MYMYISMYQHHFLPCLSISGFRATNRSETWDQLRHRMHMNNWSLKGCICAQGSLVVSPFLLLQAQFFLVPKKKSLSKFLLSYRLNSQMCLVWWELVWSYGGAHIPQFLTWGLPSWSYELVVSQAHDRPQA